MLALESAASHATHAECSTDRKRGHPTPPAGVAGGRADNPVKRCHLPQCCGCSWAPASQPAHCAWRVPAPASWEWRLVPQSAGCGAALARGGEEAPAAF